MWDKIKAFFAYSETILLARLHVFVGVVLGVFLKMDPGLFQSYVPPQWVPIYLLVFGVVLEYARRRNDPSLGKDS